MARKPRFFVPGYPQHVIQRGNNRQPVFFNEGDFLVYRECLREACLQGQCELHAYVLMTNHTHLLISPRHEGAVPETMKRVGQHYAQYLNRRRERTGTPWEGRYYAATVDTDNYFLMCSRYIELNPVRAGMVESASDYRWSSFHANAADIDDALITPHELYLSLGDSPCARARAYRQLFENDLDEGVLDDIRSSTHRGWPLGSAEFRVRVEEFCERKTGPSPRGGPRPGAGRRAIKGV